MLTLTLDEYDFLLHLLGSFCYSEKRITTQNFAKLQFLLADSGDACRHPAQSPEVVGQGGILTGQEDIDFMQCHSSD